MGSIYLGNEKGAANAHTAQRLLTISHCNGQSLIVDLDIMDFEDVHE